MATSRRRPAGRVAPRRRWRSTLAVVVTIGIVVTLGWTLARPGAAEPGTPPQSALGAGTRMGPVELLTADLDGLRRFYTEGVGLTTVGQHERETVLGRDGVPLLRLVVADRPADDPRQAGLYHSAFLFPDATALAQALVRTATVAPASFQGASDHRVSQAFYFADPDGNGVELYVDRPREQWRWQDDGVVMGSEALDPNAFIAAHLGAGAPGPGADGVTMGHVHLRGGDLDRAEEFYADALGFAVTRRGDGAVFLAADGYHHHLAINTWSSAGAGTRPESLGLGSVTVHVADTGELDALQRRLTDAGIDHERADGVVTLRDPWGNQVIVSLPG
ncbi:VOC family protein [Verrucosispora sp. TAA-831]|uniref:VOC family protein n=1 Tax=Verrucosispora sp. TAA-831 TaxID=3422227 RepID=UPI003D6E4558